MPVNKPKGLLQTSESCQDWKQRRPAQHAPLQHD